jgi:glucose-1-phosphate thymidylyltransferase
MKCFILASGFGTRLYPLTLTCAKPLLPYRGKPMINHIVDKIPENMEILVNINKKFEMAFYSWQKEQKRPITLCVENVYTDREKLGAIGALNYWIKNKNISEDLLLFGSDNYFEFCLNKFMSAYNGHNLLVAVHDIGDPSRATQYGVVKLSENKIIEIEEKPLKPRSSLVATACWILPARIFPIISDFCQDVNRDNLGHFIAHLIKQDEVYAYPFTETWIDIGSLETYYATR